jgi:ribosomal protein S1
MLNYISSVDMVRSPQAVFEDGVMEERYAVGKKVKARILFVNIATKTIGLTLRPDLVMNFKASPTTLQFGERIEACTVKKVFKGMGLVLKANDVEGG